MPRSLTVLLVLFTAYPLWAQNNYPSTAMPEPPLSPPLSSGPAQAIARPTASAATLYPSANASEPTAGKTQYEYQLVPPTVIPNNPPTITQRLHESSWYTRIDYFHWNERVENADFVNEYGTLATLGYEHRADVQRFRGELFGATMLYVGAAQFDDGSTDPLHSTTKYLGLRGEYELLIEPEGCPQISFFAGIGTRFWIRDMKDDVSDSGYLVQGYQETWWTIYPYLGIERRRTHEDGIEFYYAGRIGCTPITYERVVDFDTTLYPQIGVTGQLEVGIRGRRFTLAACFEGMTWNASDVVRDSLQPISSFTTAGIKAGYCF